MPFRQIKYYYFKSLYKAWSDSDDFIPFRSAAVSTWLFSFVSMSSPLLFLFPLGHCSTQAYSSSFAATVIPRAGQTMKCFREEVKNRCERQNSPLLASAKTVFISTVMATCQVQVVQVFAWRVSLSVQVSISEGNATCTFSKVVSCLWHDQANTDPSVCWVMQNATFLKTFFGGFAERIIPKGWHWEWCHWIYTLLSGHKLIPRPESMAIFSKG